MKIFNFLYLIIGISVIIFSGCTKADYGDNVVKGDPPPVSGGYTNSNQIASSNLVAYWNFNDNLTDSVSGKSATNFGTTFTDGVKGSALQGASTAYATFDPSAAIQNLHSFSVAFWIYSPTNVGAIGIFSLTNTNDFWGSLDIYQDNGGTNDQAVFKVHINNANVPWAGQFTDTKVSFNKWDHITITYNDTTSTLSIYEGAISLGVNTAGNPAGTVNPVLHGSDPSMPPVIPYGSIKFINATAIAFGAFQFQTNPSLTTAATSQPWATDFAGALDEFKIWDRALTPQEVSALVTLEKQGR